MANDNSSKLKHNQIIFCIQPWIVEFSRPFVFGEDRLRERGSLTATVCVLTRVFSMANDNSRIFNQNQIMFCIPSSAIENSMFVNFGENRLRERGSLPATFYVLTMVIFSVTNDNCRAFKQNQIFFCIPSSIVKDWRLVDFGEDRLRERSSLPATFYVLTRVFSMANDNSRKFKQNQIIFCMQPWFVEYSRPIIFGEDRLRERGSLPATFYVLTRVFSMANDNSRKFKQNQIIFCMQPWFVEYSRSIVFGEYRLRDRGSLPASVFYQA